MGVPLFVGDRVLVQTTTPGTGTYQLGPALDGFFTAKDGGVTSGSRVSFIVVDDLLAPTQVEVGEGIYTEGSPAQITRPTIKRSTSGGAAVNWGVGVRYLMLAPHAGLLPLLDTDGKLSPSVMPASVTGLQTRVRAGGAINLAHNTSTTISWSIGDANTLGLISSTPASVLPIAAEGVYRMQGSLMFARNGSGQRVLSLLINGNTHNQARARGDADVPTVLTVAFEAALEAGAQVRIDAIQDSGGVLTVGAIGGELFSNFFVTRVR